MPYSNKQFQFRTNPGATFSILRYPSYQIQFSLELKVPQYCIIQIHLNPDTSWEYSGKLDKVHPNLSLSTLLHCIKRALQHNGYHFRPNCLQGFILRTLTQFQKCILEQSQLAFLDTFIRSQSFKDSFAHMFRNLSTLPDILNLALAICSHDVALPFLGNLLHVLLHSIALLLGVIIALFSQLYLTNVIGHNITVSCKVVPCYSGTLSFCTSSFLHLLALCFFL